MKKLLVLFIFVLSSLCLCGCNKVEDVITEEELKKVLNLNVYELKYHNVAKYTKKKHDGIEGLFEKNRKYWIEYDGVARLSIDAKKAKIEINKKKIKVYLPVPEVTYTSIDQESLKKKDAIIASDDNFFNSNKITADDQKIALANGQDIMVETIMKNKSMLENAQNRAKVVLENHINRVSEVTGVEYEITWELEDIVIEKDTKK